MATATSRVLENYELLEMILKALPLRKLFVVQSVCQTWECMIAGSKTIQQKLFLLPQGAPIAPYKLKAWDDTTIAKYDRTLTACPLPLTLGQVTCWHAHGCSAVYLNTTCKMIDDALLRKHSYRQVFLTQPPCTTAMLIFADHDTNERVHCSVRDPGGLRMGYLLDVLEAAIKSEGQEIVLSVHIYMPVSKRVKEQWEAQYRDLNESKDRGDAIQVEQSESRTGEAEDEERKNANSDQGDGQVAETYA